MFFKLNNQTPIKKLVIQYQEKLEQLDKEKEKYLLKVINQKDIDKFISWYYCSKFHLEQIINDLKNLP